MPVETPLARAETLLKATYRLLEKCEESPFVQDPLEMTITYDEAECDGYCLMNDIEHWFSMSDLTPPERKEDE